MEFSFDLSKLYIISRKSLLATAAFLERKCRRYFFNSFFFNWNIKVLNDGMIFLNLQQYCSWNRYLIWINLKVELTKMQIVLEMRESFENRVGSEKNARSFGTTRFCLLSFYVNLILGWKRLRWYCPAATCSTKPCKANAGRARGRTWVTATWFVKIVSKAIVFVQI